MSPHTNDGSGTESKMGEGKIPGVGIRTETAMENGRETEIGQRRKFGIGSITKRDKDNGARTSDYTVRIERDADWVQTRATQRKRPREEGMITRECVPSFSKAEVGLSGGESAGHIGNQCRANQYRRNKDVMIKAAGMKRMRDNDTTISDDGTIQQRGVGGEPLTVWPSGGQSGHSGERNVIRNDIVHFCFCMGERRNGDPEIASNQANPGGWA
ncbi:hypothetical protein DFH07DRAFT_942690 [Mycena maculata]|uniref:Uncharacterized protein n=1 Tax=Mycena maculata TaxID=230809 RepID=A0AAD7IMB9_9AGAR|nr:hypothetical protein DFH07DRAFT_942690 [Mycena maculata]